MGESVTKEFLEAVRGALLEVEGEMPIDDDMLLNVASYYWDREYEMTFFEDFDNCQQVYLVYDFHAFMNAHES